MIVEKVAAAAPGPRDDGSNSNFTPDKYRQKSEAARLVLTESRNDDGRVTGLEHCWLPLGAAVNRALGAALRARRAG